MVKTKKVSKQGMGMCKMMNGKMKCPMNGKKMGMGMMNKNHKY